MIFGDSSHETASTADLRERVAAMENVVAAAVLVTVAFRMKNENALVETLRTLSEAVADMNTNDGEEN
jgi:hypothetical protein